MLAPRDFRIDLLRGIALLVIYSDHIRGNPWQHITPAAVGYSDMAEVFVFLSGYSSGLSLRRALASMSLRARIAKFTFRGVSLLLAWGATVILLVAIAHATGDHLLRVGSQRPGVEDWLRSPSALVQRLLSLRVPAGMLNILLMYALFVAVLPVVSGLFKHRGRRLAVASILLYCLSQSVPGGWHLPGDWQTSWYFSPAAWQVLFFVGVALAIDDSLRDGITHRRLILWGALTVLLLLVIWRFAVLPDVVAWTAKADLQIIRLVHFAALALIVSAMVPSDAPLRTCRAIKPLLLCGRNSLAVFCSGVLLAELASRWLEVTNDRVSTLLAVNIGGWFLCVLIAWARDRIRQSSWIAVTESVTGATLQHSSRCSRR